MHVASTLRSTLFLGAAAFAASLFSFAAVAPALAQQVPVVTARQADADVRVAKARYDDLDLRSAAGRSRLDGRVRAAVRQVCSAQIGFEPVEAQEQHRRCRADAFAQARPQVEEAVAAAARGERFAGGGFVTIGR